MKPHLSRVETCAVSTSPGLGSDAWRAWAPMCGGPRKRKPHHQPRQTASRTARPPARRRNTAAPAAIAAAPVADGRCTGWRPHPARSNHCRALRPVGEALGDSCTRAVVARPCPVPCRRPGQWARAYEPRSRLNLRSGLPGEPAAPSTPTLLPRGGRREVPSSPSRSAGGGSRGRVVRRSPSCEPSRRVLPELRGQAQRAAAEDPPSLQPGDTAGTPMDDRPEIALCTLHPNPPPSGRGRGRADVARPRAAPPQRSGQQEHSRRRVGQP